MSITREWQSASTLPLPTGADDVAERLVLLAHYGADWDVWGGARRVRYWDALAERVKAATFAGPGLADWWTAMSMSLPTAPRNKDERADLASLLACDGQRAVLSVLRNRTDVVVLRVRVIAENRRAARESTDVDDAEVAES